MSIFTLIKNCFLNKKKYLKPNTITIQVLDNGFFEIDFGITNTDKDSATNLANILFKMHNGKLYDDTVNAMIEHSKNYPENAELMLNTIYSWGLLLKKKNLDTNKNDDPIIKPSRVFFNQK